VGSVTGTQVSKKNAPKGENDAQPKRICFFGLRIDHRRFEVSKPSRMQAQDNAEPSTMLPLDQYLMDRDGEIAMARSAA
jgi:hypothetical protein